MEHYDALPIKNDLYYTVNDFAKRVDVPPASIHNQLNENYKGYKPELEEYVVTVGSENKKFIAQSAETLYE